MKINYNVALLKKIESIFRFYTNGDDMILNIASEQMLGLIKAFYNLTGIKIAIYDNNFKEVLSYPAENSAFCKLMEMDNSLTGKCDDCNANLCHKCAVQKKTIVYKCHAGLTEVISPLDIDGVTVGYVIYGQITNEANREKFITEVKNNCKDYGLSEEEIEKSLKKIKYCNESEISATLEIINALTLYIVYKGIVYVSDSPLGLQIVEYIDKNLSEDLSVTAICRKFAVSKVKLYSTTKLYMPEGIAKYIRKRRIQAAEENIRKNPDKPLWRVAEECGFDDYNYFLRVFRTETGKSARAK